MLKFIKYVLATIVGLFLFSVIALLLLFGVAAVLSTESPVAVQENSVLKLSFDRPIQERAQEDPLGELGLIPGRSGGSIGLIELRETIARAKADSKIKGIFLDLSLLTSQMASIEEIRHALIDFKKSKKFIVAYAEIYTEESYYLASVADKIYLNPVGLLEFNGLAATIPFFKGTFEKLEIKPEIFRVGDFKSAVEPLFLDKMSEASRLQTTAYLNSLHNYYLEQVALARKLDAKQLRTISDSMLIRNAEDALKYKLVTHVGYYDEAEAAIRQALQIKDESEKINFVSLSNYSHAAANEDEADENNSRNRIAVIVAAGDIVTGKGNDNSIGADKFAAAIRKARLDDKVKAVVLRINSPGGSALASDVMWREVVLTKKVKPIIASMSDVAASGGYYMAMGCDTIVAHPNTITGSIGVFGVLFNTKSFLNNKLGVMIDGVKTGEYADLGTPTRPVSAAEKRIVQTEVERIYHDFTSKAAQGRRMPVDELKKYASGRVWSGVEAKEHKLVDVFGGLDDAIKIAAHKAGLKEKDYQLRYLPEEKTFIEKIMSNLNDDMESRILKAELGENYQFVNAARKIRSMEGVQARLPFDLMIK